MPQLPFPRGSSFTNRFPRSSSVLLFLVRPERVGLGTEPGPREFRNDEGAAVADDEGAAVADDAEEEEDEDVREEDA